MCYTGVRNTCHNVRRYRSRIPLGKQASTFVAHFFYIDSLVGRSWVAIVYPKERTDLHLFERLSDCLHTFRGDVDDLSRSQLLVVGVAKIDICKAFKGNTVCVLFPPNDNRGTPITVTRGIKPLLVHHEKCHGAVYNRLYVTDSLHDGIFLTDQGSDQFCCIDLSGTHFLEMRVPVLEDHL